MTRADKLSATLIQSLQNPEIYPHKADDIEVIETHISWVLLAGDYAYKIKKPVNFGFLNFSTLAKRQQFCSEEIRLNRRMAAKIYLEAIPIYGAHESPTFSGPGQVIEYAVKMHKFPQGQLLDRLAVQGALSAKLIENLAEKLAQFHLQAASADSESHLGSPEQVSHWFNENFQHIEPHLTEDNDLKNIMTIRQWGEDQYKSLNAWLWDRKKAGCIKECHGDLHLGNIVELDGTAVCFDCIEFNEELRWIDVMSEAAFLFMDLSSRAYIEYGYHFLSVYLQVTGDYSGLRVFTYYTIYRAIVRAKVALLQQSPPVCATKNPEMQKYRHYIDLALKYIAAPKPSLIITHGLSGCGKSYWASRLVGPLGALQIRSDLERKRIFGYSAKDKTKSPLDNGIYTATAGKQTYDHLANLARLMIRAGYSVIVDATFLKADQRFQFQQLANELAASFLILEFTAPTEVLRERIIQREKANSDASEACEAVLGSQLIHCETLSPRERQKTITLNTATSLNIHSLVKQVRKCQA